MAIKVYKEGNVLRVEDSAQEDSFAYEPSIRYSYYFDPPGSNNVIITNDFREKTVFAGLITDLVQGDDANPADKAAGITYLNEQIG